MCVNVTAPSEQWYQHKDKHYKIYYNIPTDLLNESVLLLWICSIYAHRCCCRDLWRFLLLLSPEGLLFIEPNSPQQHPGEQTKCLVLLATFWVTHRRTGATCVRNLISSLIWQRQVTDLLSGAKLMKPLSHMLQLWLWWAALARWTNSFTTRTNITSYIIYIKDKHRRCGVYLRHVSHHLSRHIVTRKGRWLPQHSDVTPRDF